jgi:hypothetical protein
MSTLWTPDGERPIRRSPEPPPRDAPPGRVGDEPSEAATQAQMDELEAELARAPAEVVIANHAFGLFQLAALHLSQQPPQLPQARLAIDALAALVEGLAGRLGEGEKPLAEGLAQLRMTFVHVSGASRPPQE